MRQPTPESSAPFRDGLFLFWAGLVVTIVLTVVAAMKNDLRWLLWIALLFSVFPIWHIAKNIGTRNDKIEIFIFFYVPFCLVMYGLYQWLDPISSISKPHIAMIPRIEVIENQGSIGVMFDNRGREDVEKPILRIGYSVNGHEQPEEKKELPILRTGTNRVFYVLIVRQAYDGIIAGTVPLTISASVSYQFHGKPYVESCITTWSLLTHRFDYTDC